MASVSQGDGDEEMISGINVTPLVDITLVLLIIFMVTATYIVHRSIQVNLPKAANGGQVTGKTFMVVVKQDGTVVLDGAPATDADLTSRVRAEKVKDPEMRAVISADGDALHKEVVHVIDVLKGEGITKFALDVERADRPAAAGP